MEWKDHGNDVAYLDFVDREGGYIKESIQIPDTGIVLDFDEDMRLVGIETYTASQDLPEEISFSKQDQET